MKSIDLPTALAFVEGVLAEAEGELGPRPAFADSAYLARQKAVMDRCAAVLTKRLDARISDRWDGCRVRIAGITATCTAGMPGGFQNWITAARRKIEAQLCPP